MEWRELDLDKRAWTIPRERAKNDRQHVVHLSDLAMEIIEALPQIVGPGSTDGAPVPEPRLVFTNTGRTPVSGFSKAKERLDRHMLEQLRSEMAEAGKDASQAGVGKWILHDLRRTAATGMASLNIAPHVVDRIGHGAPAWRVDPPYPSRFIHQRAQPAPLHDLDKPGPFPPAAGRPTMRNHRKPVRRTVQAVTQNPPVTQAELRSRGQSHASHRIAS